MKEAMPMNKEKAHELLRLLERDASVSDQTLADMLSLSKDEVVEMKTVLKDANILSGIQAMVNWDATDNEYASAMIEITVNLHKGVSYQQVADVISQYDEVEALYLMSGAYDYLVLTKRLPMHRISGFVNKLATLDHVQGTATHIVMQRYKDHGTQFKAKTDGRNRLVISQWVSQSAIKRSN